MTLVAKDYATLERIVRPDPDILGMIVGESVALLSRNQMTVVHRDPHHGAPARRSLPAEEAEQSS